jgi:hypothetical protein
VIVISPEADFFSRLLRHYPARTRVVRNPALDANTREFWLAHEESTYYQAAFEPVVNRLAPFFRPPLSVVLSTASWSVGEELNRHSRVVCVDVSHLRGLAQQVVGQLAFSQFQQSFFARDYRTDLPRLIPYQVYCDEFARFGSWARPIATCCSRCSANGNGRTKPGCSTPLRRSAARCARTSCKIWSVAT